MKPKPHEDMKIGKGKTKTPQSPRKEARFLQAEKRLAACFLWIILVGRPVRQALALDTFRAIAVRSPIANAKAGTIVMRS
jgi:hypothetical protein